MSDILIRGMEMPKEGFIEILIRDDGTVQQTGQSFRIEGTDYYAPYIGETPAMYEAVDAIEQLNKLKWIPVTERLPKEVETVIVTDGKNVGFSFCVNDYGTLEFYSPWNITHWMPLPEPPPKGE